MSVLSIIKADSGGCAFYRMEQPGKRYSDVTKAPLGIQDNTHSLPTIPQWQDAMSKHGIDSVLLARTFEGHQSAYWTSLKRALPSMRLIMDFDDLLWKPCPLSSYKPTPQMIANLDAVANMVDVLVASTKPMADALWHRYKKKSRILPNMIDPGVFRRPVRRSTREKMRVFWGGSATHQGDIALLEKTVRETSDKYEWHFMGWCPDVLREYVRYHDGVVMGKYYNKLASIKAHVGIAPLANTAFNKCKSNVKLLEYGAAGMATIASSVYPYNNSAARLVVGSDFTSALLDMENETARYENAVRSQEYANSFSIKNNDQLIINAYK